MDDRRADGLADGGRDGGWVPLDPATGEPDWTRTLDVLEYLAWCEQHPELDAVARDEWQVTLPGAASAGPGRAGTNEAAAERVWVSTRYFGHVFAPVDPATGRQMAFETMVFGAGAGPLDRLQLRYLTRAQALRGHALIVALVREVGRRLAAGEPLDEDAWNARADAAARAAEGRRVI